jgi:hypothetical protein
MGGHGGAHRRGERGGNVRGSGARLGVAWGLLGGAMGRGCGCCSLLMAALLPVLFGPCVRKKTAGRRKEKKKKRKEKKRKNMKKIPNLKIFREKNKRQFMKLVKIIFLEERYMQNYK